MQQVRVLVGKMPPILLGILKNVIACHPQSEIIAEDVAEDALLARVRDTLPDVVVLPPSASFRPEDLRLLLCGGGMHVRVVALNPDHKSARRHELVPDLVTFDDVSPESLGDAIFSDLSPRWAVGSAG